METQRNQVSPKTGFTDKLIYLSNRYSYLFLPAVLLFALIIRIGAVLDLSNSIYFDFLLWDERIYHDWAIKIANGDLKSLSLSGFAPLPAYIMAFVYKLFSQDIIYVRVQNIVFGVLTCYLIYLIGKELANRTTGLFASLIAVLYKPFIFYSIVPLKTSLSLFLFALNIYLLVVLLKKHTMIKTLFLGIAIGLMLNVRPNCIVLIPLLLLIILWNTYRGRRSLKILTTTLIIYFVGLSISIAPFTIKNYWVTGEFAVTTSQSGSNLYLGNNPQNPDPYYRPVPFASPDPFEQGVQFTIEASRRTGKKLSPQEASSYWTREVIQSAMEQPGTFLWKICQKTLVLFNQFEAGDHYHIGFISDFVKFFKFPFISLWLILPFGMAGMFTTILKSKKLLALGLIFFLYGLTLVAFFTNTRYRLPMLVILIPFAVIGIDNVVSHIRQRQWNRIGIYSAIFLGFFIIEFLPVRATDDMTAYYNTHAIILDSNGLEEEAVQYWENSSEMNRQYSAFADYMLAVKRIKTGDFQNAVFYLEKIPDSSFAAASKYELIGDMMIRLRQIDNAIQAYEKALEINSGQRRIRIKLSRIYFSVDRKRSMEEYEKFKYLSSFYEGY